MKKYLYESIVFVTGAVVMIFELVGSRVLSPYFGTSLIVWTSIIGIVLGALSIGYWLGGKLADRTPRHDVLAGFMIGAGLYILMVAYLRDTMLDRIADTFVDIRTGGTVASLALFAIPSILLGAVSPYAIKLKLTDLKTTGATVGSLYAVSTIGSITGTFCAGFYLIPMFSITSILIFLTVLLIGLAIILLPLKQYWLSIVFVILGSVTFTQTAFYFQTDLPNVLADVNTPYSRVLVFDRMHGPDMQIRYMQINNEQSSARFVHSDELVFDYTRFYHIGEHFFPNPSRALMIGGAGYSFPVDFLKRHANAQMDVVEIDPGVTEVAKQYFGLTDDPRMRIAHEDARTFLNRSTDIYDIIYGDAFHSYAVPYQLTTIEAAQRMHDLLSEKGIVLANVISAIDGDAGKFFRAEYATFKEVFPHVYVFPVSAPYNGTAPMNLMMVALKDTAEPVWHSDNAQLAGYLANLWTAEIAQDMPILTDEYAPTDYYAEAILAELGHRPSPVRL